MKNTLFPGISSVFLDNRWTPLFSHLLKTKGLQLVVKDTEAAIARTYRTTDVQILGSKLRPPPGYQVQAKMTEFLEWLAINKTKFHPIEYAALAHHRFVAIHPFEDGNGRTGRLFMNLLLMRTGYPIAIILKNDRAKYYNALEEADRGDPQAIVRIVGQAVERTLNIYLSSISKSSNNTEALLLSELAKKTEFSAKYLNLLARKGLLQAQKEGRNWYSSLNAVENYKQSRIRKHS